MDIWELNMEHCKFDMATKNDIDKVLEIYNSNSDFLEKHLGASRVSKEFIANEMEELTGMSLMCLKTLRISILI